MRPTVQGEMHYCWCWLLYLILWCGDVYFMARVSYHAMSHLVMSCRPLQADGVTLRTRKFMTNRLLCRKQMVCIKHKTRYQQLIYQLRTWCDAPRYAIRVRIYFSGLRYVCLCLLYHVQQDFCGVSVLYTWVLGLLLDWSLIHTERNALFVNRHKCKICTKNFGTWWATLVTLRMEWRMTPVEGKLHFFHGNFLTIIGGL